MVKKNTTKRRGTNRGHVNPMTAAVERMYNRSAPLLIAEAILFAVASVFMLMRPVAILTALTFVIGAALIVFGLYRTVAGFVVSRQIGGGWMDVLFGLVNILLGVVFCAYPVGSVISVVYIFVIMFLLKALHALVFAINMARAKFGHYVFDLIMALILVALAILLLVYPVAGAIAVVYYLAATLAFYAIANIYMYIELRRLKRVLA